MAKEKLYSRVLELQRQAVGFALPNELKNGAQISITMHLEAFLDDLRSNRRDEKYLYNLEKRIDRLCRECSWTHVRDITPDKFMSWRARQNKAAKTLNEYLDAVSALWN